MSMITNELFEESLPIVGLIQSFDGKYYWQFDDGSRIAVEQLAEAYKVRTTQ